VEKKPPINLLKKWLRVRTAEGWIAFEVPNQPNRNVAAE
jgi:hypothetical protein